MARSPAPSTPVPTRASTHVLWMVEVSPSPSGSRTSYRVPVRRPRPISGDRSQTGMEALHQSRRLESCLRLLRGLTSQHVRLSLLQHGRYEEHNAHGYRCDSRGGTPSFPQEQPDPEREDQRHVPGAVLRRDERHDACDRDRTADPRRRSPGVDPGQGPHHDENAECADAVGRHRRKHTADLELPGNVGVLEHRARLVREQRQSDPHRCQTARRRTNRGSPRSSRSPPHRHFSWRPR